MRQVFASQRVETVEGVAAMLRGAGIEVVVRNGQSYRGRLGGRFSFAEPRPATQQPSVWVRFADDQTRARELLREQGLLDSTRPEQRESYAMAPRYAEDEKPKRSLAWRIRLILLALIAAAAMFTWLHRPKPQPQPAPASIVLPPAQELGPDEERIPLHVEPAPKKK